MFTILIIFIIALLVYLSRNKIQKLFNSKSQNKKDSIDVFKALFSECMEIIDPLTLSYTSKDELANSIYFETLNEDVIKNIPLKTIKFIKKDGYGYYRYKASLSEYNSFFGKGKNVNLYGYLSFSFRNFIKNDYANALDHIEKDKVKYQDILIKYELTFVTVLNTIRECIETNKKIPLELEGKTLEILKSFTKQISKRKSELDQVDVKVNNEANKSYEKRLDFELEYLNRINNIE